MRRALALDACVRCGICDLRCSVAPLARYLGNPGLLPSHKLLATGALAGGRLLRAGHEDEALRAADGAFLCTDCGRCTSRCPVGIDLADLWQAGRGDLAAAGLPTPAQWVQANPALEWAEFLQADSGLHTLDDPDASSAPLSSERSTFSRCVQCQTCTNVCPVVAHSIDAEHGIDLTPQKVMNLLRLGLRDLTLGSRMVWDCATCYQCQESCPEGIRVADIMCELRGLAVQRLGSVRNWKEHA
jgi:heterodisulfide reductase subunit C